MTTLQVNQLKANETKAVDLTKAMGTAQEVTSTFLGHGKMDSGAIVSLSDK